MNEFLFWNAVDEAGKNLMSFTRFYRVLLGSTGFYWVLLGFTGFYWVLPSFTEFSTILSEVRLFQVELVFLLAKISR